MHTRGQSVRSESEEAEDETEVSTQGRRSDTSTSPPPPPLPCHQPPLREPTCRAPGTQWRARARVYLSQWWAGKCHRVPLTSGTLPISLLTQWSAERRAECRCARHRARWDTGRRAKGASIHPGCQAGVLGALPRLWALEKGPGWSPWQVGKRRTQTTERILRRPCSWGCDWPTPCGDPVQGGTGDMGGHSPAESGSSVGPASGAVGVPPSSPTRGASSCPGTRTQTFPSGSQQPCPILLSPAASPPFTPDVKSYYQL